MAKNRASTPEERRAAIEAVNAPRQPRMDPAMASRPGASRPGVRVIPTVRQPLAPKQPATPLAANKPNSSRVSARQKVQAGLRPWSERTDAGASFGGKTEKQWINSQREAMEILRNDPRADPSAVVKDFLPQANEQEIEQLASDARDTFRDGGYKHRVPTAERYATAHTKGSEEQWINNRRAGGYSAESLVHKDKVTGTDQRWKNAMVDIQDISTLDLEKPRINIPVLQTRDTGALNDLFHKAERQGWSVDELREELYDMADHGELQTDKFLHEAGKPDVGKGFEKDFLVGNVHDRRRQTNLLGPKAVGKGTFNPQLGRGEYAVSLKNLRTELGKKPFSSISSNLQQFTDRGTTKVKLNMPLDEVQQISGSKGLIEKMIKPDVLEAIDSEAMDRGFRSRKPGITRYHAGIPVPDPVKTAKGAVKNWKGGLGNTVLSGASRETGKALGRGDVKGAATAFATEYATGAVAEAGLRGAAKSKVGQRIATAVGKRAAPALARWGAGTGGSGGLLAPVMTAITAVDLADGVVEGVTGKGTIDHAADNVRDTYTRTTGDKRTDAEITSNLTGPKTPYQPEKVGGTQLTASAAEKASAFLEKSTGVKATPAPVASITPGPGPSTDTVSVPQKENWAQSLDRGMTWLRQKAGF